MTPLVEFLDSSLKKQCAGKNFGVLGLGAERHGSWEWSFHKTHDGLNRFIIIAFTPMPAGPSFTVDVWAAADDGNHFARMLVTEFVASEEQLRQEEPALMPRLAQNVDRAAAVAFGLQQTDLVETYLPSRLAK